MDSSASCRDIVSAQNLADLVEFALQSNLYRQVIVREAIDGEAFLNMLASELCKVLAQKHVESERLPAGIQFKVEHLHSRLVEEALKNGDKRVWNTTRKRLEAVNVPFSNPSYSTRLRRLQDMMREDCSGPTGEEIVTELLTVMKDAEKRAASTKGVAGLETLAEEGLLTSFAQRWPLLERSKQLGQLVEGWQQSYEAQQIKCPPQASNSELQYQNRAPYVALIVGPPGSGKTALADRIPQSVTEASELPGCSNQSFAAVLRDSFSGPRPLQFAMDLSRRDFSMGWPELVALAADEPARWLGLLCLLAWADTVQRGIHMETLISRLSDRCFLHLEAYHVWEALHQWFGRRRSFLHFVLDEASVLKDTAKDKTRRAFSQIPFQVGKVSRAVTFWLTLLSTRLMGASSPALPPQGDSPSQGRDKIDDASSKKSRPSELIDQTTFSGMQEVRRVFLSKLSPESAERLLRITCDAGGIRVPDRLPKAAAVVLEYAGSRPRHIEAAIAAMGGQSACLNKALIPELRAFIAECDHDRLAGVIRSLRSLITQQEYFKNGTDRFGAGKTKFETMRAMVIASMRGTKVPAKASILDGLGTTWANAVESGHLDNGSDELDYILPKLPFCVLDTFLGFPEAKLGPLVNLFGESSACYNFDDKEVTDLTALAFLLKLAEMSGERASSLCKILNLNQAYGPEHPLGMQIKLNGLSHVYRRLRSQWSEDDFEKQCDEVRDYYCPPPPRPPTSPVVQPKFRGNSPRARPLRRAEQGQPEEISPRKAPVSTVKRGLEDRSVKSLRQSAVAGGGQVGEARAFPYQVSTSAGGRVASWAGHLVKAPGDLRREQVQLVREEQSSPGPTRASAGSLREVAAEQPEDPAPVTFLEELSPDRAAAGAGPAGVRREGAGSETMAADAGGALRSEGEAAVESTHGDGAHGSVALIARPAMAVAMPSCRRGRKLDVAREDRIVDPSAVGRRENVAGGDNRELPEWGADRQRAGRFGGEGGRSESGDDEQGEEGEESASTSSCLNGGVKRPRKEQKSPRALSPESLLSPIRELSPRSTSASGLEVADEGVAESPVPLRKRKKLNGGHAASSADAGGTAGERAPKQGPPNQGPGLFWQSVVGADKPDAFALLPRADPKPGCFGTGGSTCGGADGEVDGELMGKRSRKKLKSTRGKPSNLAVVRVQVQSKNNIVFNRGTLSAEELSALAETEWAKQYAPQHPCNLFLLCLDQRVPVEADLPPNTLVIDISLWRNLYTELGRFKRNIIDTLHALRSAPPGDRVGYFSCPECHKDYNFASWFLKHLLGAHKMEKAVAEKLVSLAKAAAAEG